MQRDRETEKLRDRDTERQRDIETTLLSSRPCIPKLSSRLCINIAHDLSNKGAYV